MPTATDCQLDVPRFPKTKVECRVECHRYLDNVVTLGLSFTYQIVMVLAGP